MSQSDGNTIYLVTGANRGIGLGLVKTLLARSSTTVIATARNEASMMKLQEELNNANKGDNSSFTTFTLDLDTLPEPSKVLERFNTEMKGSIRHIDVLISNAGKVTSMGPSLTTTAEELQSHFQTNSIAPLILFQTFWPLMSRQFIDDPARLPKLIMISSSVGSIEGQEPLPGGAYGPSKAALNWITRRLHFEMESAGLISVAVHPGWVQTAMGQFAADAWSYPQKPPLTVDQSVAGVIDVIDRATRENLSGKFISHDGTVIAW